MRLLLIEDDIDLGLHLKNALESEVFTVDLATDGEYGLILGKIHTYDLVILDNILPKKTGTEVCRELRQAGKTMPIIMLSVQAEVRQKITVLNEGADDYITKPFQFDELLARINAILRRPSGMEKEVLLVSDLTLDSKKHLVKRGDKEIHLTRKELALLEFLMRRQGNVVSRGLIMEHVWDMNADPFSNTIETHILNLRRKIDRGHSVKLIHTVSGRGYKIDEG